MVSTNSPEDLPASYRRGEFPHQPAPMASLVAAVGTVRYNDDGMAVRLKEHYAVGTMRWLRIDGKVAKDMQVLFTLKLRWKKVAWQNNEGMFQIVTRVYRPHAAHSRRHVWTHFVESEQKALRPPACAWDWLK